MIKKYLIYNLGVSKYNGRQRKRLGVVGELAFRQPITKAQ
jgi:hypothetical protein